MKESMTEVATTTLVVRPGCESISTAISFPFANEKRARSTWLRALLILVARCCPFVGPTRLADGLEIESALRAGHRIGRTSIRPEARCLRAPGWFPRIHFRLNEFRLRGFQRVRLGYEMDSDEANYG